MVWTFLVLFGKWPEMEEFPSSFITFEAYEHVYNDVLKTGQIFQIVIVICLDLQHSRILPTFKYLDLLTSFMSSMRMDG